MAKPCTFACTSAGALLLAAALAIVSASGAHAAGTTPLALQTQFDNSGNLMPGCLLYFYLSGTVATPQPVYQDFALSTPAPNPLVCSAGGRVPQHWLADGLVHIRLTDASGVVVVDTTMQTLGPSSGGGGGGGGGVDPTAVASTGDVKVRLTNEVLAGWVILNGTTVGSASSGATQRANADTQNLFIYLWSNCPNSHCPVVGGRGASGLADFSANKQITLPDLRGKNLVGRDCMNTTCAGLLAASVITSGGTDGVDTAGASGGASTQTASSTFSITQANLPAYNLPVADPGHAHAEASGGQFAVNAASAPGLLAWLTGSGTVFLHSNSLTAPATTNITVASGGSNTPITATSSAFTNMGPFVLGTAYIKL